ncbi:hypothetical protein [Lysobacter gummosus]|uniref:hypothetical protein n=1 Tax=Lysobacter gummosus TaxID=262324 RepID=UPI003631E894
MPNSPPDSTTPSSTSWWRRLEAMRAERGNLRPRSGLCSSKQRPREPRPPVGVVSAAHAAAASRRHSTNRWAPHRCALSNHRVRRRRTAAAANANQRG